MLLIDEIAGQDVRQVGHAPAGKLTMTVRELLHARVELEWHDRIKPAEDLHAGGRAAPESHEARLNRGTEGGVRGFFVGGDCAVPERRRERMCAAAEQAFLDQRIFVLLDDRQAESLDQVIEVDRTGAATFLLLTPLQGG
ncbi:hypothetical protein [Sphingomonas sp. 35-24ZXX]|uniref:hypothetical protein n=1 Tax=Sphingomonas sp. 35-24ZXX TaxID=1545915 RepID=UPI000A8DE550|nr:hypothetical protein [Sphingomonas sp. 35-24ZXX]